MLDRRGARGADRRKDKDWPCRAMAKVPDFVAIGERENLSGMMKNAYI
jgi:hypothetical protein